MDASEFHSPRKLSEFSGSRALLASNPEAAVVFVHGFDGDPEKTWVNFQYLVDKLSDKYPLWKKCDLFFFSYKSRPQITPLAETFVKFVRFVLDRARTSDPGPLPSGTVVHPMDLKASYRELIVVGHSTGSVIIREALLQIAAPLAKSGVILDAANGVQDDGVRSFESSILNSSLRFFAPADIGVIEAGKLGYAKSMPVLRTLVNIYLARNQLYQNLKPGGPLLTRIQHETERLYQSFSSVPAFAALSLFGSDEEIVIIDVYQHEQATKLPTVPGHSHVSICKPLFDYLTPLEFVTNALRRSAT